MLLFSSCLLLCLFRGHHSDPQTQLHPEVVLVYHCPLTTHVGCFYTVSELHLTICFTTLIWMCDYLSNLVLLILTTSHIINKTENKCGCSYFFQLSQQAAYRPEQSLTSRFKITQFSKINNTCIVLTLSCIIFLPRL